MMSSAIKRHKIVSAISAVIVIIFFIIIGLVIFSEAIIKFLAENKGSERLGRKLYIEGPLIVDWHWKSVDLSAEKIRLTNSDGYPDENMLEINRLDFTLRHLKLLHGRVELDHLDLDKLSLVLER